MTTRRLSGPMHRLRRAALLLTLALPCAAWPADYYLSPTGNDANTGTSPASPWRTLAKASATTFAAGDRILLQGSATFQGSLTFDASDTGTALAPITVSTYGTGRATIQAGNGNAIYAYNTAGLSISNLDLVGSGASTNTQHGILFYADRAGNVKLPYIRISDVSASGFRNGIVIGSWNGTTGYSDVLITRCEVRANQRQGIFTYGAARGAHTNVTISHCNAYDNLGDPALYSNSGNGIVLAQVAGGVIERSRAWNNGIQSRPGYGPVGIWAYDSDRVVIQFNESFANRTSGTTDGGGFDLDISMTNSVMQYNYSHDNDGAGFGLYQGTSGTWSQNVVRYNVSENDGRRNGYGAITVWGDGGTFNGCEIYGNTIYVSPSATGSPRGVRVNSASANFRFFNNIIIATGGLRLVDAVAGQTGMVFQGNNYWTYGGAFNVSWGGTLHGSLAAWANASGQEKIAGALVGLNVDPGLSNPGGGGTIGDANALPSLSAYRLLPGSPMIDAGLNLPALYGIDAGPFDYYGTALPQGAALDIGANEFDAGSGGPNQAPVITGVIASPNPSQGTTVALAAVATDDGSPSALVYTWSVVSAPSGASVSFSVNGSNAASSTVATFTAAGAYTLRAQVRDAQGLAATADVTASLVATPTRITVTPATAGLKRGGTQQFSALLADQFGRAVTAQPAMTWSVTPPNSVSSTGLVRAGTTRGTFTVTAKASGFTGTATFTVR